MQWNAAASGGGLAFPLQNLMAAYGPTEPINDWIFQKPGATIDTPANLTAAQHLAAVDQGRLLPEGRQRHRVHRCQRPVRQGRRRVHVQRRLAERQSTTRTCPATSGFFVFPPAEAGGRLAAMSAPADLRHRGQAKNADCAAFFLNWVATNETAREINVAVGGSNPGGPPDLPIPPVAAGSVTNETLAAGAEVAKDNGAMDFIANATGSIFAQGWTPELQKLVGGKKDAAGAAEGRPGRVREGTQPVDERRRRRPAAGRRSPIAGARRSSAARPADPLARGIRRQTAGRLAVRAARPRACTPCSSSSRSS